MRWDKINAVEIQDLTYTYPGTAQPTLKHISLTIPQGDSLAVVGNNGCGKSTLCKVLNGLIPHFITGSYQGSTKIHGLDTLQTDVGALARKVGYVYQDFENQIVRPTVLDDASYSCLNYAFPDYLERGRQALSQCGLEGREDAFFYQEFTSIDPEQSFYWGEDGSLVLVFDEGSVLPASSGNPEVTIPAQVVQQLMEGA